MYFKVKIGKLEDLLQLQKDGVVYCNTLKYFTQIEDGDVRGDKHENAFEFKTFKKPELLIKKVDEPDSKFRKLNVTWGQLVTSNSNPFGNLYCLYSVNMTNAQNEGQLFIDKNNSNFGTHALVFLDTPQFLERLFNELDAKKLKFHYGHVDYIDLANHNGQKTLFQKDLKYSYQNEFRIFIETNIQEPLILKLGDMSDISTIYDFESFRDLRYKRP